MSNTSKTIQLLLEASTARKPTEDAAKARESLYRPDSLPCIAVELDGATISVNSAPPPTPAPLSDKDKPLLKPVIPSTQGIAQYNDVTPGFVAPRGIGTLSRHQATADLEMKSQKHDLEAQAGTVSNSRDGKDERNGSSSQDEVERLSTGRYHQSLSAIQVAMGLTGNQELFAAVKAAISRGIRKVGLGPKGNASPGSTFGKTERSHNPSSFERLAWLVRQDCPILHRYNSSWPIHALVGLHRDEVQQQEQEFKSRNGSTATLPDFHSLLLEEVTEASFLASDTPGAAKTQPIFLPC
ncbi:hypothetical protein BKA70DRAFT_1452546 [Coprinopsis sp. MPI-PUGE-AT-0042]|nr:hypothetical protein BKA70DRAFT_1452546 [Coprinopsis sp. MPI-PUGE-AT-0042]